MWLLLPVVPVNVSPSDYSPESDDLKMRSASFLTARLLNSETLKNLFTTLPLLPVSAQADLINLISKYPTLFNDFPTTRMSQNMPLLSKMLTELNPSKGIS